jgi:hypothetical protein
MSHSNSRAGRMAADQKMIDGITRHLGTAASLTIGSQAVTPAAFIGMFEARLASAKTVQSVAAARATAVKADQDERAKNAKLLLSLKRVVVGMFSESPDTLADFGLSPPKTTKKTVAVKATAIAKTTATRKARSTMGSKQKSLIKGAAPSATPGAAPQGNAATGPAPGPAIPAQAIAPR